MWPRVFLLSPARLDGRRSALLLRPDASFELAVRLRSDAATLGEIYSFISGLYFRGKVAYTEAFGIAPENVSPGVVIVPGVGLLPLAASINADQLRAIGSVSIERDHDSFRTALLRDARLLEQKTSPACRFILLGSIATHKYTQPLLEVFGERLMFPAEFVGRGDMSRGGLMLRSARSNTELAYVPLMGAVRHGQRPPKLEPLPRRKHRPEAVIFVGLPGSGKTTYYQEHFAASHVHVSLDLLRTADRQRAVIQEALATGKSFVLDNTSATRAVRQPFVAEAKADGYRVVCCFFDVPARIAIGRNNYRKDKGAIPTPAILRIAKRLEPPAEDEGFDEILLPYRSQTDL